MRGGRVRAAVLLDVWKEAWGCRSLWQAHGTQQQYDT